MKSNRLTRLLIVVVSTLAILPIGLATGEVAAAEEGEDNPLTWLALGDSYSSGEGLAHINARSERQRDCQLAVGTSTNSNGSTESSGEQSSAWPAHAAQRVRGAGVTVDFDFYACSGAVSQDAIDPNLTDPWRAQVIQALSVRSKGLNLEVDQDMGVAGWNIVTATFGGNDVGFRDVLFDCMGIDARDAGRFLSQLVTSAKTFGQVPYIGCDISQDELNGRVSAAVDPDMTTVDGSVSCGSPGAILDEETKVPHSDVTLAELYSTILDCVLLPGGMLVVVGYPQLFADPGEWRSWMIRCGGGISSRDASMIREVQANMNDQIRQLADELQARWPLVDVVYIDPNQYVDQAVAGNVNRRPTQAFETNPDASHSLCGGGEDWLNGVTVGWKGNDEVLRFERSFHPNQQGHSALSRMVANEITSRLDQGRLAQAPNMDPIDIVRRAVDGEDITGYLRPTGLVVNPRGERAPLQDFDPWTTAEFLTDLGKNHRGSEVTAGNVVDFDGQPVGMCEEQGDLHTICVVDISGSNGPISVELAFVGQLVSARFTTPVDDTPGAIDERSAADSAVNGDDANGDASTMEESGGPPEWDDRWVGTYTCAQGLTQLALWTRKGENGEMAARFDFDWEDFSGSFLLSGTVDGNRVTLEPDRWIRKPRPHEPYPSWFMVGMEGTIVDGTFRGDITGEECTTFDLSRAALAGE